MTTVAVLCDSPHDGVLPALAATPLSPDERADLYAAMCKDVFHAVEESATDLLVNYRTDAAEGEAQLEALAEEVLDRPRDARFEPQVGSTFAGRVGNTLTHLLETEGESSAMALTPTAAFLTRGDVDGMAMKLRRNDVVVGPTSGGRVYAACFGATIDFADAYTQPAITTLTDRALDAGLDVDYAPMLPVIETPADLAGALALVEARRRAGRRVPQHTAAFLAESGVTLTDEDGDLVVSRPDTDRA